MKGQMLTDTGSGATGRWPQGPVSSFDQEIAFGATERWSSQVTGR